MFHFVNRDDHVLKSSPGQALQETAAGRLPRYVMVDAILFLGLGDHLGILSEILRFHCTDHHIFDFKTRAVETVAQGIIIH